jgi:uncharacterized protein (TIGR03437 family)
MRAADPRIQTFAAQVGLTDIVFSENGVAGPAFLLNPVWDSLHILTVTHANGKPINPSAPSVAGEELVAWALGLGPVNPSPPSGQASPTPAPITGAMKLLPGGAPDYAGLSPGFVGLYQINFRAPSPAPGTPPCTAAAPTNLIVGFTGLTSADTARICAGF